MIKGLLFQLRIPVSEFISFISSGAHREPVSGWVRVVLDGRSMFEVIERLKLTHDDNIQILQNMLQAQVLVWLLYCPEFGKTISLTCGLISITHHYLNWPWNRACRTLNCLLGLPARETIFVLRSPRDEIQRILKKRFRAAASRGVSLSVPAPSLRLDERDRFRKLLHAERDAHQLALNSALERSANDVPCGNPINAMMLSLCYESALRARAAIIVTNIVPADGLVFDVAVKLLSRNILNSIIRLPVISKAVRCALLEKKEPPVVAVCRDCGHCLNFGKGKFKKVHFKPTSLFYCRDQKEKQFTICSSTGRIYCSFCGGSAIRKLKLCEGQGKEPLLRAVVPNNAVICLRERPLDKLHVVLPCLGDKNCVNCCLRLVSSKLLIYLTQRLDNFYCQKCAFVKS